MFPNNKEISNLIDEYNELNNNDKSNIKKKGWKYKTKIKDKFKIFNYSINDNYDNDNLNKNKNLYENKNIKILKENIYEKYNIIPLTNKRFNIDSYENNNINNKSYSNLKNNTYNILSQNKNSNEELIYEQNKKINNLFNE